MYRRNSKRLVNYVLHLSCHAFEKQEKNYQFLAGRQTSNFTCSILKCDNILNHLPSIPTLMFQLILEWVTHLNFRLLGCPQLWQYIYITTITDHRVSYGNSDDAFSSGTFPELSALICSVQIVCICWQIIKYPILIRGRMAFFQIQHGSRAAVPAACNAGEISNNRPWLHPSSMRCYDLLPRGQQCTLLCRKKINANDKYNLIVFAFCCKPLSDFDSL